MGRSLNVWILYSGYGNIGDEAILQGTLNLLKQVRCVEEIKMIDVYPRIPKEFDYSDVGYVDMNVLIGSRIRRVPRYCYTTFQLAFPHVHYSHIHQRSCVKGLLWHRGGSGYDGYHGSGLLIKSSVVSSTIASHFAWRVLGGLSMAFTRNQLEKSVLKKFLAMWNWILVREPISMYYIKDIVSNEDRVLMVHDFSLHVDGTETERSRRVKDFVRRLRDGNGMVGLILRDYYYQSYYPSWYRVKYLQFIKNLVRNLTEQGQKVVLIPFGYLGGRENDIKFYQELKAAGIINYNICILSEVINMTPGEVVDVLSIFDYVISTRTHGFILASLAGVPAILLYYEHKGKGIVEYTFNAKGYSLISCLSNKNDAMKIIENFENEKSNKNITCEIQKARKHNERTVSYVFKQIS